MIFHFRFLNNSNLECTDCIKINETTYSVKSTKKEYGLDLANQSRHYPLKDCRFCQ